MRIALIAESVDLSGARIGGGRGEALSMASATAAMVEVIEARGWIAVVASERRLEIPRPPNAFGNEARMGWRRGWSEVPRMEARTCWWEVSAADSVEKELRISMEVRIA